MYVSVSVSRLVPPGPVLLSQHPVERSDTKLLLQSFTVGCFRRQQQQLVLRKPPLWRRTVYFLVSERGERVMVSIEVRELDASKEWSCTWQSRCCERNTRLASRACYGIYCSNFTVEVIEISEWKWIDVSLQKHKWNQWVILYSIFIIFKHKICIFKMKWQ